MAVIREIQQQQKALQLKTDMKQQNNKTTYNKMEVTQLSYHKDLFNRAKSRARPLLGAWKQHSPSTKLEFMPLDHDSNTYFQSQKFINMQTQTRNLPLVVSSIRRDQMEVNNRIY